MIPINSESRLDSTTIAFKNSCGINEKLKHEQNREKNPSLSKLLVLGISRNVQIIFNQNAGPGRHRDNGCGVSSLCVPISVDESGNLRHFLGEGS